MVTGVPRFSEILNVAKSPRIVLYTLYLRKPELNLSNLRTDINHTLIQVKLKDIVTDRSYIYFDKPIKVKLIGPDKTPIDDIFNTDISSLKKWFYNSLRIRNIKPSKWGLLLRFDETLRYKHRLSLVDVAHYLRIYFNNDILVLPSPERFNEMVIIRRNDAPPHIIMLSLMYIKLENFMLGGITGMKSYSTIVGGDKKCRKIICSGGNFIELMKHNMFIPYKCMSDNIREIKQVFGIEATRKFLVMELKRIMSSDGSYVNLRHIELLSDFMTRNGILISVSRYGLNKQDCGPLAKASFEESLENFLKAGIYTETEDLKGVSASVMVSKRIRMGTGLNDLLYKLPVSS